MKGLREGLRRGLGLAAGFSRAEFPKGLPPRNNLQIRQKATGRNENLGDVGKNVVDENPRALRDGVQKFDKVAPNREGFSKLARAAGSTSAAVAPQRVAVVGGGYGGYAFLRSLAKRFSKDVEENKIDKSPESPLVELIRFDDGEDPVAWKTSKEGDEILLSSHQIPSQLPPELLRALALNLQDIFEKYTKNKSEKEIPEWFISHAGRIEAAIMEITLQGGDLDEVTLSSIFEGFSRIPRQVIGDVIEIMKSTTDLRLEELESQGFVKQQIIKSTVQSVAVEGDGKEAKVVIVAKNQEDAEVNYEADMAVVSTGMHQLRVGDFNDKNIVGNVNAEFDKTLELARRMIDKAIAGEKVTVNIIGTGPAGFDVASAMAQMVSKLSVDQQDLLSTRLKVVMFSREVDLKARPAYDQPTYGQDPNTPKIHPDAFKKAATLEELKKTLDQLKTEILSDKTGPRRFTEGEANAAMVAAVMKPGNINPEILEQLTGEFFGVVGPYLNDGGREWGMIKANLNLQFVTGASVNFETIKTAGDKVTFVASNNAKNNLGNEPQSTEIEADAVLIAASTVAAGNEPLITKTALANMRSTSEDETIVFALGGLAFRNKLEKPNIALQLTAISTLGNDVAQTVADRLASAAIPGNSPDNATVEQVKEGVNQRGGESHC